MLGTILGKVQPKLKTTIILPIYEMVSPLNPDKFNDIAGIIFDVFKEHKNIELVFVGMDDDKKQFNTNVDNYFNRSTVVGGGSKTNTKNKKLTKKHISKKVLSKRKQ